jgi:hypothetical protein
MALEGVGRHHPVLLVGLAAVDLWAGLVDVRLLLPVVLAAAYLLGLGLWQLAVRPLSRRLGLEVLVVVPAGGLLRGLVARAGLAWPGSPRAWTLDLHVNSHVRVAGPDALLRALDADLLRLVSLWQAGALGDEGVVVLNTFNRHLVRSMVEKLGPHVQLVKGCVLLRESADAHTLAFMQEVQTRMFGQPLPQVRARTQPSDWDLVVAHLRRSA